MKKIPPLSWLLDHLGIKIASLIVALILWAFVHIEERGRMVVRAPLQVVNIPEDLMIVNDLPPEIQITVEGPRTLLGLFNPRLSPYRINLKEARAGVMRVQISPQNIRIPRGLEIREIYPSTLTLELKETASARLPVRVKLQGSPPEGYLIANVEIVPPQLEVIAPREELRNLHYLFTEPIPLEGWTGVKTIVVPVNLDELKVKGITTQEVEVTLEIVPRIVEAAIPDVPVSVRGGGNYTVAPRRVHLKVRGPEPLIRRLQKSPPVAEVEPPRDASVSRRVPVQVSLPSELTLLGVSPPRVFVKPIK